MKETTKKYIIYGIVGIVGVGGIYYFYTISKKTGGNKNISEPANNEMFVPENLNANTPLISNKESGSSNNINPINLNSNANLIPTNLSANIPIISDNSGSNTETASVKMLSLENTNEAIRNRQISGVRLYDRNGATFNPLIEKLAKQPYIPALKNGGFNQPTIISY